MQNVIIYSTPTCHFCHAAKDFFKEHNIPFTDHDVLADQSKRAELIEKSGQMGVPVILVGNEVVVGFDKEQLVELLGINEEEQLAA